MSESNTPLLSLSPCPVAGSAAAVGRRMTLVGRDDRKGFRRMEEGTEEKKSERASERMNEEHHSPGAVGPRGWRMESLGGVVGSRHKLAAARKGVRLTHYDGGYSEGRLPEGRGKRAHIVPQPHDCLRPTEQQERK